MSNFFKNSQTWTFVQTALVKLDKEYPEKLNLHMGLPEGQLVRRYDRHGLLTTFNGLKIGEELFRPSLI